MINYMKKILLLFLLPLYMHAESCYEQPSCFGSFDFNVQLRASAYFPFKTLVQDIYGKTWGFYEAEVGTNLCDWLEGYFSAGYLNNSGRSLEFKHKTRIQMVPLVLGVKGFYALTDQLSTYLGAGIVYSLLYVRDHSPFVRGHVTKTAFGGTVKGGLTYFFCDDWFVDASVDYLFQHFTSKGHPRHHYVKRHTLDMSGIKLGAGIGRKF